MWFQEWFALNGDTLILKYTHTAVTQLLPCTTHLGFMTAAGDTAAGVESAPLLLPFLPESCGFIGQKRMTAVGGGGVRTFMTKETRRTKPWNRRPGHR